MSIKEEAPYNLQPLCCWTAKNSVDRSPSRICNFQQFLCVSFLSGSSCETLLMIVVVMARMLLGLVVLMATLTTQAAASVRSERQADLIRNQLLKDLGMEAAPDTTKVRKIQDYVNLNTEGLEGVKMIGPNSQQKF